MRRAALRAHKASKNGAKVVEMEKKGETVKGQPTGTAAASNFR
jgi:hypothetical protein